ncbi:MAG: hypothetical protein GY810_31990 [Aureispira sp.]|nr:hypothetical protein [Aureispira sp.]
MKQTVLLIGLMCFSIGSIFGQTTLYIEDFSDTSLDEKGQDGTTLDVSGVTNWTIDPSGGNFASGDYLKQTSGEFRAKDTDGNVFWGSLIIDISCYTNVTLSVQTIDAGNNDVQAFYRINGGALVSMGAAGSATRTVPGLTGSTVQIVVRYSGTSSTGYQAHDNVSIVGDYSSALCVIPAGPPACGGNLTDSDAGTAAGTYGNNINYTSTVCPSTPGELTTVTFNDLDIGAGDVLNIYEGDDISGPSLGTVTSATSVGFSVSSYDCITFNWITDGNDNGNEGFMAAITCEVPVTNTVAADDFANAPTICDLSSYSGSTTGNTPDVPFGLKPLGNNSGSYSCPSATFKGAIENNSWLKFVATSTSVTMDVVPGSCQVGWDGGIQMAIFSFDGSSFTRLSDCALSQGGQSSPFTITATPLTIGDTYYIMVDGNAGARCPYTISMQSGFTPLAAAASPTSVCAGDPVTLSATGGSGSNFIWFADDPAFGSESGNPITVNPTTTTTYTVLDQGECAGTTANVAVTVTACASCSISNLAAGSQTACVPATNTYTQEVTITYTNAPGSGTLDVNGQSFAIGTSPQTVTLTGLVADGNPVSVTASFSANPACTLTAASLFTAPAACGTACTPDNGSWD